jgi:hypothetical protein
MSAAESPTAPILKFVHEKSNNCNWKTVQEALHPLLTGY